VLRHIQVGKRLNPPSASAASHRRRTPAHEAVDAVRVGPVGLDGDRGEALFVDQPPRDRGAIGVELVRAVRGFAEEHDRREKRCAMRRKRSGAKKRRPDR
jgi:hypothetical protein